MMKAIVPVQRHIKPWEDVRFSCAICSSPKLAGGGWGETISSTIGGVATSVVGDQLSQRLTSWLGGGGNKEGEDPAAGKPAESTLCVQFSKSRHHTVSLSGVLDCNPCVVLLCSISRDQTFSLYGAVDCPS